MNPLARLRAYLTGLSPDAHVLIAALIIFFLTSGMAGCGAASPTQGAGALYIFDHGVSRCVNIRSVTFVASHWTNYVTRDGREFSVGEPVAYYSGEQCPGTQSLSGVAG